MSSQGSTPKVLLFDIGGVCVVSPFQAIIDYEAANSIPKGYINYAISASKPNGAWHRGERGEVPLDTAWFAAFKSDIERPDTWRRFHREKLHIKSDDKVPPSPSIDSKVLYSTMMSTARDPDPYMAPALQKLKASNKFRIAALSNTTILPDDLEREIESRGSYDVRTIFDLFISSAHVGMRKPNRDIYEYTMRQLQARWPDDNIEAKDVVFLDDIGENLRTGKQMGWRTIKVLLGRTNDAVRELEGITGLKLLEDNSEARRKGTAAKL